MSYEAKRRSETAPEFWHEESEHSRKLAQTINGVLNGQTNNHFQVTMEVGDAQTKVKFPQAKDGVSVLLFPQNAKAALLSRESDVYASGSGGEVTITHGTAGGGEIYSLVIIG